MEDSTARRRIKAKMVAKIRAAEAAEAAALSHIAVESGTSEAAIDSELEEGLPSLEVNDDDADGLLLMLEENTEHEFDEPALEDNGEGELDSELTLEVNEQCDESGV